MGFGFWHILCPSYTLPNGFVRTKQGWLARLWRRELKIELALRLTRLFTLPSSTEAISEAWRRLQEQDGLISLGGNFTPWLLLYLIHSLRHPDVSLQTWCQPRRRVYLH